MKIIKSFLLLGVSLCATTFLHAQEMKTKVLELTETKAPPVATVSNKPSPAPEIKPMNGVAPTEAPATALETPAPLKRDKDSKPVQNMSAEQAKILAGKTERPKPIIADVQSAKPPVLSTPAPVAIQAQQNQ